MASSIGQIGHVTLDLGQNSQENDLEQRVNLSAQQVIETEKKMFKPGATIVGAIRGASIGVLMLVCDQGWPPPLLYTIFFAVFGGAMGGAGGYGHRH